MPTKQALKVFGTILFLWGVFGYIFPHWGHTNFSNNENLFHVLSGLFAVMLASASPSLRRWTIVIYALGYLALGIAGFAIRNPESFHIGRIHAELDMVDNIMHCIAGLAFAWIYFSQRRPT